jgi:CheY-like chemotaxis protein
MTFQQADRRGSGPHRAGLLPGHEAAGAAVSVSAPVQGEYDLFVGRVSHELQSILQNTEGFAAALLARAGGKLDDRERHYLERIRETVLRGNGVLHAMTGYWRLATCAMELADVDPRRVLQRACERVQGAAGREVEWRCSGTWPQVRADAGLLEHALVQLLDNAVKFSGDAPMAVVELAGAADGTRWTLRVTDRGAGFDPAEAHRLFQPCSRLHAPPLAGHGMGLATVRRIAERLGGETGASATPGAGAVFTLTLPLAPARPEVPRADPAAAPPRRVLLIDDDPLVLASLGAMLELAGCEVTPAADGAAGLAAFEHDVHPAAFDLVVTDWGMPGVGGEHVARRIKRLSPATAVLVVTGRAPADVQGQVPEVDGVLGKPLRLADLKSALGAIARRAA